jgi:hypothetical protein
MDAVDEECGDVRQHECGCPTWPEGHTFEEVALDRFEYKVLSSRLHGVLQQDWFDGPELIAHEIDSDVLSRYGEQGWEVVATLQYSEGTTNKIILKRATSRWKTQAAGD